MEVSKMSDERKYYSPAQNRATQKYLAANRDQLRIWVHKGDKARLEALARAAGVSVAQYVITAVNTYAQQTILTPSGDNTKTE